MKISIENLRLKNFKGHSFLNKDLQGVTNIAGRNGEGKTSIGDAITWCLYGTDAIGNTLDPTPLQEYEGHIEVSLLLNVDDKSIKVHRAIEEGKNAFSINDVPQKATEYKEFVESLVDKHLFLSIFNPTYFFSQHWKEQREQLLKYIQEPLNKEVLDGMVNVQKVALEEPLKKHSLNELDKIHRDCFKKADDELKRQGARMVTLKEQYEKAIGSESIDLKHIEATVRELEEEARYIHKENQKIREQEKKLIELRTKASFLQEQIYKKKAEVDKIKNEPIPDTCDHCGQSLDAESREAVTHSHESRLERVKQEGKDLVSQLQNVQEQIVSFGGLGEIQDLNEFNQKLMSYKAILLESERITELKAEMEKAKEDYEKLRFERNESQSITDAIKSFVDVKSELMAKNVNDLFEKLSVKLFEKHKNESVKQTFEIEMDGKPFAKLSTAEKIKCGLELIHVLQEQSGITGPTFIDNAESIIEFEAPYGQLIIATVKDMELIIEGESNHD